MPHGTDQWHGDLPLLTKAHQQLSATLALVAKMLGLPLYDRRKDLATLSEIERRIAFEERTQFLGLRITKTRLTRNPLLYLHKKRRGAAVKAVAVWAHGKA